MDIIMEKEMPYRHGGTPQFDLLRLNLPLKPVLDFSVNLNPLGPPQIIKERWMEIIDGIENYPSQNGDGVVYYYEKRYGISPKNFLAGNGSTEMIYLIPKALGLKRVVVIMPSYHDYFRASIMAGAEVIKYDLLPEYNFSLYKVDKVAERLKAGEALWLANPNNPTGTLFPKEFILELAKKFPEKWIIVDEAFMPFVEEREETSFMVPPTKPNILIIHSLTKFYSLAGLRLGGIIGDEEVISNIKKIKEPWTVNGVAEKVAPLLLECEDYEAESRNLINRERERFFKTLESINGVIPYPSWTNFILCQWQGSNNLDDLIRYLLSNGLYVRDCRNFTGLEKGYFRFAIRCNEENDRLMTLLANYPRQS